jgi:cytolysin-activating lysine-acyltransferase
MPPIALKQFRLFAQDNRPVGFAVWAFVSDEVEARLKTSVNRLKPNEWTSGDHCWLIDLVAPMGGAGAFVNMLQESVLKGQTVSVSAAVQFAVKNEEKREEIAEGNGETK